MEIKEFIDKYKVLLTILAIIGVALYSSGGTFTLFQWSPYSYHFNYVNVLDDKIDVSWWAEGFGTPIERPPPTFHTIIAPDNEKKDHTIIDTTNMDLLKNYDFEDKDIIICPYVYAHDKYGNDELITARERIIKRSLNLKWQEEIHEYIPLNGLKMGISDIKIHHNKQYGTSERNLTILERIIEKNKINKIEK